MEYYKKRSCVCNPLAFGLSRSCTKLLNGHSTIHSLSADELIRFGLINYLFLKVVGYNMYWFKDLKIELQIYVYQYIMMRVSKVNFATL